MTTRISRALKSAIKHLKIAAFADDILLFLTEPTISIPSLLADFSLFKNLSNLQINFTKSKALNITLPKTLIEQCKLNFPFGWETHAITYLGIKIPTNLKDLYARNFQSALQNIQKDLQKWHLGSFSWIGRTAILKMNALPRLLYLFQTIPIRLPKSFFIAYKRMCRVFIWATKTPRLSWDRLVLPKLSGGLGLPDLQKYHWACHLTRIVDWHLHRSDKDWITLEDSFASIPLSHLPWINPKSIPKTHIDHPLIGATLHLFRVASKSLAFTPSPGPMTPLGHNPDFPPGLRLTAQSNHSLNPRARAQLFFHQGELLSYKAITTKPLKYNIPFYKYLQIRHFLTTHNPISCWHRDLTPFELICCGDEPQRHLISIVYALLFSNHILKDDILIRRWESELSIDLTTAEWEHILGHAHKGSINVSIQENRYKIFSRWYRTPDKVHKFHPSVPPTCWRCHSSEGTLIHIWWECPLLKSFWSEIHSKISQITTYTPSFTPAQYMLHHTSVPPSAYKKSLTIHLINAANLCVPAKWRNTIPPTIEDWFLRVDKIAEMETHLPSKRDSTQIY